MLTIHYFDTLQLEEDQSIITCNEERSGYTIIVIKIASFIVTNPGYKSINFHLLLVNLNILLVCNSNDLSFCNIYWDSKKNFFITITIKKMINGSMITSTS